MFFAFFISCKKDELPVPKHEAGDVITASVNMDPTYKWQIYYDLKTNSVVGQNLKTAWDLAFEADANGFHVILNSSKAMYAYNTNNSVFNEVTDTIGFEINKKWDSPTGNLDSTAIGDFRNTNSVYIIDRGYNELGEHQGFRKIQFLSVDVTKYLVRFANLDGSGDVTLQIEKDDNYNFTFLSFTSSNTLIVEPPKNSWDLVFTQYLHVFENPIQPYLVVGCLLNRYKTSATMNSSISFSEIDFDHASTSNLSSNINTIGYDWKTFTGGVFITHPEKNYIIKDSEGFYYKLHFVDFYNQSGEKGNPTWKFQQL